MLAWESNDKKHFYFIVGTNLPLTFAPENGHMLGGTMVNLTGPCFKPDMRVTCR